MADQTSTAVMELDEIGSRTLTPQSPATTASTSVTGAPLDESDVDGAESNFSEDEEEDEEYRLYRPLCIPFWDWVSERTKSFAREDLPSEEHAQLERPSEEFAHFKARWRQRFDWMRAERRREAANTNNRSRSSGETSQREASNLAISSPLLTSPPLRTLEINVLDDNQSHECPCCLPEADPDITLQCTNSNSAENIAGITEDFFLEKLCVSLYGEDVKLENLPLRGIYTGGLILKGFEYMRTGEYLYKMYLYENMRIWIYCEGKNNNNK